MNNNNEHRIEDILGSLDGMQKASAPNFFYTRLRARMERELVAKPKRSILLRPAYAIAGLVLILTINAAVLLKNDDTTDTTSTDIVSTNTEAVQSIAAEYSLNDNNV